MHWINVVALAILFMSGMQIFNAHPALNWGKSSYTGAEPLLEIGAKQSTSGELQGYTRILGHEFDTTGVLGVSRDHSGEWAPRGFPGWLDCGLIGTLEQVVLSRDAEPEIDVVLHGPEHGEFTVRLSER